MYKLKIKTFVHRNIPYSFNWNKEHHKEKYSHIIANRDELNNLKNHFKQVYEGTIPNSLFNSREFPRVSQFKIRGIKSAFVRSYSKSLIRSGKIHYYDSESKLPRYAQKVFTNFHENDIPRSPGHEPILKNILIKDEDAIAIEVPIWVKKENMAITGHIDLIQIENDVVKVIDYKPEGNFLLSLPQVAMYGYLLKSKLNLKKIRCVSFNKRGAWEYEPNILKEDIREYLLSQHIEDRPWEDFI
ncbi:MAG: PD-(D/E)XK nuclease family protein [Candidatus Odinarchaeota archaeon]